MSDIAVKLESISKFYKLYNSPKDRLKEALHPFKKKFHKRFYALQNINLEIKKGEILGIVGKNGSGKSTLLKLICEIIQPSSGKVVVNGAVSALLDLSVGLNPEFTGIQNIYFSGTMMGFSRKAMDEKIDDIVAFAEIGDFIQQPLKTYSSGMKARLGFALAINMDPEILILDEVLSVGDELFRRKCYAKMEEFFESGCTILYVSHSANTVNEICSRAILLDKGELILKGPPKFVTLHYQRYLYASSNKRNEIRDEIIQLDRNEEKKKEFIKGVEKKGNKKEINEEETSKNEIIKQEPRQKAFYLATFNTKTQVVQKNEDIDVYDIYISTLDGKKVNCLVSNEEYIFTYKVKFKRENENVYFPFVFKNEKGLKLSGTRYPRETQSIKHVEKNRVYVLKWKFKCNLLHGVYYIDVGISELVNGEKLVLVLIRDAIAFKVQKIEDEENNLSFFGIFCMDQEFEGKNSFK